MKRDLRKADEEEKLRENANHRDQSASCRTYNGTQPLNRSIHHFRNVVFARSLPEMYAARHDMVEIACGCAAYSVFCSPGSPTYVSLPEWRPVPSALGWPSAMHATAERDHSGSVCLIYTGS